MVALALTGLRVSAEEPPSDSNPPAAVQEALDLLTYDGMIGVEDRLKKVVPLGDVAVPYLVRAYEVGADQNRGMVAMAICRINTALSREAARRIISENKFRLGTSIAIYEYPAEFDLELAPVLIRAMRDESLTFWASERLVRMIEREPSRAGLIVDALDDREKDQSYVRSLGDVLTCVAITGCYSPPSLDKYVAYHNAFWRQWWAQHKDENGFEWLIEPATSRYPDSRENALQRMGYLRVEAARPYLLAALKSPEEKERYWGAVGLSELNGWPPIADRATEANRKAYVEAVLRRLAGEK